MRIRTLLLVLAVILAAPRAVGAESRSGGAFSQRVEAELLREGVSLARLGLRVHIARSEAGAVVSLVDVDDGEVVARRRVARLSGSRAARIAQLTMVAAELVSGLEARAGQTAAPEPAAGPPARARRGREGTTPPARRRRSARAEYDERYLYFDEVYVATVVNGTSGGVHKVSFPLQGKYGKQLSAAEFYDVVGRPALADRVRSRSKLKLTLMIAGGASMSVSPILLAVDDGLTLPLTLLFGGATAAIVGIWLPSGDAHIAPDQVYRMADEYNQDLRRELGLKRRAALHVAPYVRQDGGGLAVGGVF